MKNNVQKSIEGLFMNDSHRSDGSAVIDGKEISWDKAYMLTLMPMQETRGRVRKYKVAQDYANAIEKKLAEVNWGAYISLDMSDNGKEVIDVNVICDWVESLSIF